MTRNVDSRSKSSPRARDDEADPGFATVAALHAFQEHCPRLVRLALPFALAAYLPRKVDYAPPAGYTSSHPLRTIIGVSDCAIGRGFGEADAERWARHLLQLFLQLEVPGRGEERRHGGERWRMVCAGLVNT